MTSYFYKKRQVKLQKELEKRSFTSLEIKAAVSIQSFWRGFQYRRRWALQQSASIRIQALMRGHLVRKMYMKYKPIWLQQQSIDKKLLLTRNRLAAKERDFRVYSVMSSSRVKSYDREQQSKAAIKIQKVFRGYRVRTQLVAPRQEKQWKDDQLNDEPRWNKAAMDDPSVPMTIHHSLQEDLKESDSNVQDFVAGIVTKLILEQQRRASLLVVKDRQLREWQQSKREEDMNSCTQDTMSQEILEKGPGSLKSRIAKASALLDAYYSDDPELGRLSSYDLSLGCYELRMKTSAYMKALQGEYQHPQHVMPRYPVPSHLMKVAKQQHSVIKRRLKYPWWARNIQDDEEWQDAVKDASAESERLY